MGLKWREAEIFLPRMQPCAYALGTDERDGLTPLDHLFVFDEYGMARGKGCKGFHGGQRTWF